MKKSVVTDDEVALDLEQTLLALELTRANLQEEIKLCQRQLANRLKELERQASKKVFTKHYSVTRSLFSVTQRLDASRVKRLIGAAEYARCCVRKEVSRPHVTPRLSKSQRLEDAKK